MYLHTGDFRASPALAQNPLLGTRRIDVLYLDTTYCNPQYKFPEQQKTLDYIALTSKQVLAKRPGTLIVVGTYGIGKEKVFMAIAKALGVKACVEPRKMEMLRLVAPELLPWLTLDKDATPLHVLPIFALKRDKLVAYLARHPRKTHMACWRPTGWTHTGGAPQLGRGKKVPPDGTQQVLAPLPPAPAMLTDPPLEVKPSVSNGVAIYGVPYSEHSSYSEMESFVQSLRPVKIIPTVNVGSAESRDKMDAHFRKWMASV